jgi:hypothetical protein
VTRPTFTVRGILALAVLVCAAPLAAQTPPDSNLDRPSASFSGCNAVGAEIRDARAADSPTAPRRTVDPMTRREFAGASRDEIVANNSGEEALACWSRIDGLWQEDITIALDKGFEPAGWASLSPGLETLASGVYTTPRQLVVDLPENVEDTVLVRLGPDFGPTLAYRSGDGVALDDVLRRGGRQKVYRADSAAASAFASTLTVDVTRTGYARIRLGDVNFLRPRPGTSKADWAEQISDRDPFMIGFTMENMIANRRGYDVTSQNPDRFLDNPKAEVFSQSSRGYSIDQRRIVPLGLKLIKEDAQGIVHYTSAVSSEREFQRASSSSFGGGVGLGLSSGKFGASVGAGFARERFQALKQSSYVAEETGFMRYKKYALVLDPPYAQLSDAFIDAVDDARRTGDYIALIEKFGTHYAYAITYGAAGRVSQYVTRDAFVRQTGESTERSIHGQTTLLLANASAYHSTGAKTNSSVSESNEHGHKTFSAVGGNGSWSEAGFAAGESPYPILADLRPIDELLGPLYFPGEPDIYVGARRELAVALESYLLRYADLSGDTLLPDPSSYVQVAGCWAFTDERGRSRRNRIQLDGGDAIIAASASPPGQGFRYLETEPNTFRAAAGSGIYFFGPGGMGTWRSNDARRLLFRLRLIGPTC